MAPEKKLTPAKELYPEMGQEPFYGPGHYGSLLQSIAPIVVQVDDNDYQGDSRVLYRKGNRWGVLFFGWGSCSGCDALQACSTYAEIDELRDGLAKQVKWGTRAETIAHLKGKDFADSPTYGLNNETVRFLEEALAALEG